MQRVPEILRRCRGRRILHLGCADVPYTLDRGEDLLHKRLATITDRENLWGIDVDADGVRLLGEMGFDRILVGDCTRMKNELLERDFDIVLAGEIIEHLDDFRGFLESIAGVMTDRSELLLTTVNATAIKGWIQAIAGYEKVHPDHTCYFSYHTLRRLLEQSGFECVELFYYQDVVGRGFPRLLDRTLRLITRGVPAWSDGVIALARLQRAQA